MNSMPLFLILLLGQGFVGADDAMPRLYILEPTGDGNIQKWVDSMNPAEMPAFDPIDFGVDARGPNPEKVVLVLPHSPLDQPEGDHAPKETVAPPPPPSGVDSPTPQPSSTLLTAYTAATPTQDHFPAWWYRPGANMPSGKRISFTFN